MANFKFTSHKKEIQDATDEAIETAMQEIGGQLEKFAKALAPVGTPESTGIPGYRGGTLRNSISWATNESSGGESAPIGTPDKAEVHVGTNVEYAPYQELGYRHVSGAHIPATNGGRGFLRPALQDHLDYYKKILTDNLNSVQS